MVFWEKTTEANYRFLSHHIRSTHCQRDLFHLIVGVDFDIDLDHLAEAVFVRFLHGREALLSPFSDCTFWKEISVHGGVYAPFLRTQYPYTLLGIPLPERLYSSPCLFIYSVIYFAL